MWAAGNPLSIREKGGGGDPDGPRRVSVRKTFRFLAAVGARMPSLWTLPAGLQGRGWDPEAVPSFVEAWTC